MSCIEPERRTFVSVLYDCYKIDWFFGVLSFSEFVKCNKIKKMAQRVH